MMAMKRPVCLLKDRTLRALPSDLVGRLYKPFDLQDPNESMLPCCGVGLETRVSSKSRQADRLPPSLRWNGDTSARYGNWTVDALDVLPINGTGADTPMTCWPLDLLGDILNPDRLFSPYVSPKPSGPPHGASGGDR